MTLTSHPLRERWLQRPFVDHAPALLIAAVILSTGAFSDLPQSTLATLVVGVTTVAALVMTAATFICALTYQSSNILMTKVRERHAAALSRNWGAIISGAFLAAVVPLLALLVPSHRNPVTSAVIYCLAIVTVRFFRAVFWMRYTLFMQQAADLTPVVGRATARDKSNV